MITQAAIKLGEDIWTLPRPARHHNILWAMHDVMSGTNPSQRLKIVEAKGEQGFIDDEGLFMDRKSAAIHALNCNQIREKLLAPPNLFSEDLW